MESNDLKGTNSARTGRLPRGGRRRRSRLVRRAEVAAVAVLATVAALAIAPGAAAGQISQIQISQAPFDASTPASKAAADSGSDASCPAADPADAAAASVGAPAQVRAIGGDGSATVVWCPPAQGASQVVGYTVTASNGQQVTTKVPNEWAIVSGLTDGTSYTFTVTATTVSGATGPAASSAAVVPAKIAAPKHVLVGQPQTVGYDQNSVLIGGQRVFLTAGEIDPWRTPSPSLWLDQLEKMKADGYNAATVYFDWDYSSPAPGVYDFTGVRDMNEFLNLAQQVGLYVIARPGPYINAETDGGGIPSWVLTLPGGLRTAAEPYLSAALQWFSQIDAIVAAHQITRGGDVILYQIENEYTGKSTADQQYMADLEQQARGDGVTVPTTFNQCCGALSFASGTGAVDITGTDNYPLGFDCSATDNFGQPYGYPSYSGMPVYLPEYQGGSFDGWGGAGYDACYQKTGSDFEDVYYKSNLAEGVTMQSNYMGVGGTNWGWLPAPFVYTSYDYGAAIRETGEIGTPSDPNTVAGSKYGENKLINDFELAVPDLTDTAAVAAPTTDNAAVATMARANPNSGAQFVYVRQADATSTATVDAHLALNVGQSTGYAYDDTDAALQYSGNWTHAGTSSGYTNGDYNSTESWSQQAGAAMTLTFTGTAIEWIGPKNTNGGIAQVSLDGQPAATVDTYAPGGKQFQQVLYYQSGLAAGSHTLTITTTGQKNPASSADTVVVDAIGTPSAAQQADYYPVVPQQAGTAITLQGRDARMLVANEAFGGQHLIYSTSELMTQNTVGGSATAVLYDPAGTAGETVLRYTAQPTVTVLSGSVQSAWDATRGDLRLDYTHQGAAEVRITGGGAPPLLLILADTNTAQNFWPVTTSAGPALVEGGYLVRTAAVHGDRLDLTGDTSRAGALTVWAPAGVRDITWNGARVRTTTGSDGSLRGTVPGPAPVSLPKLTDWRFSYETEEAQPGFDDSSWTLADHAVTTNSAASSSAASGAPVLYASDYGYDHGFVWYRGHFTATGTETAITVTADGISPTGAFSAWLNGAFLGSFSAAGSQQSTLNFPAGALAPGKDNVVAILVENTGRPEGPSTEPVGLSSAALAGSSAPLTWRLMGDQGGTTLQDPVRGAMNPAGLYGTNNGWDLPGYPDADWQHVSVPDAWSARGVPAGIGWYRTGFSLGLPKNSYVPVSVQIGGAGPGAGSADYRAFIFVNGWFVGRYVNNVGPQHQFYVPAGILNEDGRNTLAIAVWGMDQNSAGLDQVSLVADGDQSGGVPIAPVASPGYSAAVYGPPTKPAPTLAAVPSTALAQGSFTVTETLTNPTREPLRNPRLALSAPSGWSVSPTGTQTLKDLAPGAKASTVFNVTAPTSGLASGPAGLLAAGTYVTGRADRHTLINTAQVEVPAPNLAATFDNAGVTDDANRNPSADFLGFDGIGTAYSAEGLHTAGLSPGAAVTADGLAFTWPDAGPAAPDNTMAQGQIVAVSGTGSKLGFLAAANNSALTGTGTVYYTDGSTSTFTLGVGNFWYPAGQNGNPSNVQVAAVDFANYPTGSSNHEVYVFEQSVPLAQGKTAAAVQLPQLGTVAGYNAALHIFALAIG
ncbi:MAG TPA: beta-galactosidase [Actinocrinis sp.]|nr:beta-galactosidase [Actinocrinis sp.]